MNGWGSDLEGITTGTMRLELLEKELRVTTTESSRSPDATPHEPDGTLAQLRGLATAAILEISLPLAGSLG